jgi:large exoprotein involved in heme utilization and adhesion
MTLTVAAPEAFGFLDASVGKIQINGSQLRVAEGQTISLVGGEIGLASGAKLQAAGGRIDIVGVASAGKVQPTPNGITNTTTSKADISLTDSTVTVGNHADSKTVGTIRVQGADITANNSRLWADNNSAIDGVGHSVELSATEDIRFTGSRSQITAIANSSGKGGTVSLEAGNQIEFQGADIVVSANGTGANAGDAGDLTLKARDIRFTDGARLGAATFGAGQGGDVALTAAGQVSFAGENDAGYTSSGIYVRTASTEDDAGAGGSVTIQAQDIEFADGASIYAGTDGPGQGGTVILQAGNQIAFQGADIVVDADGTGANAGNAGDLTLQARDIRFTDGALLGASTFGAGQGGDVTLIATGQVYFAGRNDAGTYASGIYVHTPGTEDNAGAGGKVTIQAQDIEFAAGAQIFATTGGPGQGGTVILQAGNQIAFQGADIVVDADGTGANAGNAGDLMMLARDIRFTDGALLGAATFGAGQGGDVTLIATGQVYFAGENDAGTQSSGIYVRTESMEDNAGASGNITLQAQDIEFAAEAQISATTLGPGQGGSIDLDAVNQITFQNSGIFANTLSNEAYAGNAGNLTILAGTLLKLHANSRFTTTAANADGGNIHIKTPGILHVQDSRINTSVKGGAITNGDTFFDVMFIILENSRIQTDAYGGPGGNIVLISDYLLLSGPSVITSSSHISTGTLNLDGSGLLKNILVNNTLNVEQWQPVPCHKRLGRTSRLIIAGYDAHPTPVDDVLSSLPIHASLLLAPSASMTTPAPQPTTPPQARLSPQVQPLTMQQGYQLAANDADIGCTIL